MQLGSEDYQLEDSYFIIVHPSTYVTLGIILGFLVLMGSIVFFVIKKRKK